MPTPPLLASVELPLRRYSRRTALDQDVLNTISDYLDPSLRRTLSYAAVCGDRNLMERFAYRQPFGQLDPYFRQWVYTKAMAQAAVNGDLEYVQWLTEQFPECFVTAAVEEAARNGHLAILQWLHACHGDVKWGTDEIGCALRNNHTDVAHWLYENVPELAPHDMKAAAAESGNLELLKWASVCWPSVWASDSAIVNGAMKTGSLEVVKWVVENQLFQRHTFGVISLRRAAEYGQLDVIKWMVEIHAGRCMPEDLEAAANNGHFDVVKWIVENRPKSWITQPVDRVCSHANLEIVRWLSENLPNCFSDRAMEFAAMRGHLDIVRYLHENRGEGCTVVAMDSAASGGHLEVVKFLHENRTEGCTTSAMDGAAENGHLDVVQWLHAHRDEGCTVWAMTSAAGNGHLHVVEWLYDNRTEGRIPYSMDIAASNGHLEMLKWLHSHQNFKNADGPSSNALDEAIGHGHFEVFRWLLETQSIDCTGKAFEIAARNGQFEAMLILRNEFGLKPRSYALQNAMMNKELEMVQWLMNHFPDQAEGRIIKRPFFWPGVHIQSWLQENGHASMPRPAFS